jgi:predicted RNA binding protein YcfA (HicA-like mRNA interferase family)
MPKINPISGKKLAKILKDLGFKIIRIKGSHHYFHHSDGRSTTVPIHGNEDVAVGTMRAILDDAKLSVEEYNKLR